MLEGVWSTPRLGWGAPWSGWGFKGYGSASCVTISPDCNIASSGNALSIAWNMGISAFV